MAFEQRENSGALFRNDRKEKDTHPDYNGTANIEGVDYYINAWLKEGKSGKFFSFSFKRKDGGAEKPVAKSGAATSFARVLDDEVPFAPEFR